MSVEKAPLCDGHNRKMSRVDCDLFHTAVFKCTAVSCGRYYATRYGYFNLMRGELPAVEKIDPVDRQMKICSAKQHAHSYMAMIRPKNGAPEARALWRWHCYACSTPGRSSTL